MRYKAVEIEEMCPYCDEINHFIYKGKMKDTCKNCGKQILLCNICDTEYDNCKNCKYEF